MDSRYHSKEIEEEKKIYHWIVLVDNEMN